MTVVATIFLDGRVTMHVGDVREQLATMESESVDCVVTSPPYWGLRDYGVDGQIGLEHTLGEHLAVLVGVFAAVKRVLKPSGTCWVNYGDCYATSVNGRSAADTKAVGNDDRTFRDKPFSTIGGKFKAKDRMLIPARLAIALHDDGWYVRDEIVWHKPNPMPSSVSDRTTPAHEMIYLLSKSPRYFYDANAIREPMADSSVARLTQPAIDEQRGGAKQDAYETAGINERSGSRRPNEIVQGLARRGKNEQSPDRTQAGFNDRWDAKEARARLNNQSEKLVAGEKWGARHEGWQAVKDSLGGRNKRSVWTIATDPFPDAHFATFPPGLIEPCIKAGCPKGGLVLDPFGGAGTTALVALRHGRRAALIELNPAYAEMAQARIEAEWRVQPKPHAIDLGPLFGARE